jgi:hypothetical protein
MEPVLLPLFLLVYGAVERALRDASNRGKRCIFEPTEGYVFESPEEAYEFYNMYSWEQGFGIRYGRNRAGKTGRRTRQDLVCACQVCVFFLDEFFLLATTIRFDSILFKRKTI